LNIQESKARKPFEKVRKVLNLAVIQVQKFQVLEPFILQVQSLNLVPRRSQFLIF